MKQLGCSAVVLIMMSAASAWAVPVDQYATSVIGFSSQWSTSSWAAYQALGAPDTFGYGDLATAWAPAHFNGSLEYLTVGFTTPVYASGVTIRETDGNGFVYQVDVLDQSDVLHTVWAGTDPSAPGSPVDYLVSWAQTSFLVQGIKIYSDTNHDLSAWEEVDSIQLHGDTTFNGSVPEPGSVLLILGGVGLLATGLRRRKSADRPGGLS